MADDPRELAFLERLALAAASVLEPDALMELVITETTGALGVDVCSIYLRDEADDALVFTATNGLSSASLGRVRLPVGEGVTGWVAREGRPAVVDDVHADPRFRWVPGLDQTRFVAMCSAPILSGGRLVGVINVQTERPRRFTDGDVALIQAIGAQVGGVVERAELQRRLERRVEELQISTEIHRRLSGLALSGAGLRALVAAIARYAGAPAGVYDPEGEPLALSGDGLPDALRGFVDPERRGDGLEVAPIRAARDALGWLAVGPDTGGGIARELAVEHGLTVVALQLVQERAAAENESRLRGGLLQELLTATLSQADARRLARRAARLGYRIRTPIRVVVVEPDDGDAAQALGNATARRRARRALADLLDRARPGGLLAEQGTDFALLLPDEGHGLEAAEALAEQARAAVAAAAGGVAVSAGVSAGAGGPEELSRLAREARQAIRVGRPARGDGVPAVHSHARLGVERLLLGVERQEDLTAFVEQWLGALERHEHTGRAAAPLLLTLEAVVAEGWNLRAAARRLHVHVNTLLYRVARIEELVGRRLDDIDVRSALGVALTARRLVDLDESTEPPPVLDRTLAPYPYGLDAATVSVSPTTAGT
jgi:sugar diacid utilization regulator/putative methionine-R-sulfoxide reductase with GAF domain